MPVWNGPRKSPGSAHDPRVGRFIGQFVGLESSPLRVRPELCEGQRSEDVGHLACPYHMAGFAFDERNGSTTSRRLAADLPGLRSREDLIERLLKD